jgi:hypothetical protein
MAFMWCARFSESQRHTLQELLRVQGELGPDLQGALEALELARWDELPEAELPWASVSEQATIQGISEADVIWDLAGRKKDPAGSGGKRPAGKQGKRTPRRTRRSAT